MSNRVTLLKTLHAPLEVPYFKMTKKFRLHLYNELPGMLEGDE